MHLRSSGAREPFVRSPPFRDAALPPRRPRSPRRPSAFGPTRIARIRGPAAPLNAPRSVTGPRADLFWRDAPTKVVWVLDGIRSVSSSPVPRPLWC